LLQRLIFALFIAAHLAAAEPVLDTVAKVRALSPEEAARELPVRIEGTVVYFNPQGLIIFVRDQTACTYVAPSTRLTELYDSLDLPAGSRVRIEGVSEPGDFFPIVKQSRIEVLGQGPLPEPRRIGEAELFLPTLDSQWVEVPAVITGVEGNGKPFALALEVYGRRLKAEVPMGLFDRQRIEALMQRKVRIQGVAATIFNTEQQMTGRNFYLPSFAQIIPTDSGEPGSPPPLRAVNELLRRDDSEQTMVRVQGVVTQAAENSFCLRDATGSVRIFTAGMNSLIPGDRVEAEGFASIAAYRPILRARRVSVNGREAAPQPAHLDFQERQLPRFHEELIEQEAEILAFHDGPVEKALQCRSGERFFEAVLPPTGILPKGLTEGDRVRLTGICELTTNHPFPRLEWVDGFRLHLAKEGGVVILRHASWWTLAHLLALLSVVSALALVAFAWVWLLRRRVKSQTEIIGTQLQKVAVRDERQRIARELHDTVEQELTGLSMQLGNISGKIAMNLPETIPGPFAALMGQLQHMLQITQKMLHHCRNEARTSIRDLRSLQLEQRGLPGALKELLPAAASECGAKFGLIVTGEPRPVEARIENHLLRIAQEGVGNAAHHAAPGEINVLLDYQYSAILLEIRDNGQGFDPAAPPPEGHFGLLGMRERAKKIPANLAVESTPGAGTTLRVIVDFSNDQEYAGGGTSREMKS
jgi:signal transduction histidine kinase